MWEHPVEETDAKGKIVKKTVMSTEENPDNNLGGRPSKKTGDLTESGVQTRTNGSNKAVKPSTK